MTFPVCASTWTTVPRIGYRFVALAGGEEEFDEEELSRHPTRLKEVAPPRSAVNIRSAAGSHLSENRFTSSMIAAC
jgi:hypothetical protein